LVTEDLILEPLSEYNKTKMVSERVLLSFADKIGIQIVRPATVCGLSARMRLDVSVNLLTMQALQHGVLTVFGGSQIRPNIHIDDITDLYVYLIQQPELTGIFNAGFENLSILDIAKEVQKALGCEIDITPSNDPRSYRLDSSKLLNTGFRPKKGVANAIAEIADAYNSGMLEDKTKFHNLAWMKEQGLAERF
jgi:nucleoside-diphosphate-sugar epimerase